MLLQMTSRSRAWLTVLCLAAALAPAALDAAPADAAPKARDCPGKRGTLKVTGLGRVWHQGHSLYGCTAVYGRRPHTQRLGPWAPGAKVSWDGVSAAWTVPLRRGGVRSDRAWAASAEDGRRWLVGTRLVPRTADAPAREARVQSIRLRDESVAWVTQDGAVVLALHSPEDDPTPLGTLPAPLTADHGLLLLGTWTGIPAARLATTLALTEGDGDGDECGGSNPYTLTVRPDAGAPALGATWWGGWSRPFCG
jgi:hypothetical protein